MGPIIRVLIVGALFIAGVTYALGYHNDTVSRLELQEGHALLRAAYVERAGWVRSIDNEDRYRDEFSALNKWYEAALSDLHNKHPGKFAPDAALKEMEAQKAANKLKAEEFAQKKEWYDLARGFYDTLAAGKYNPVIGAVRSGVRIDLLSMKREMYEGKNRLRVDVAAWGAPRREMTQKAEGSKVVNSKMQLDFGLKKLSLEFVDEKKKLVGGGDTGAPTMVVEYPERWVGLFPPQAAFGTWWIDPLPAEAKSMTVDLEGEIRSPSGGPLPFKIEWALDARPEWKVKEGEKFEGEERLMPAEDMDRSNGK